MADKCPTSFDETLISGYIDGELTQATEQKVRIHLEDCERCRAAYDDIRSLREAAMSTRFSIPDDDQWNEAPRGAASAGARTIGWLIGVVWLVAVAAFGLWQLATSPEGLVVKLMVFGGLAALALLFLSVLADRLRAARTDRYLGVEK